MNLSSIIKQLQNESSTNGKLAILEANKDNELLREYLKAVLDPALNYYVTSKTIPKGVVPRCNQACFDQFDINHAIRMFSQRSVTGNDAKACMVRWLEDQNSIEDQELCTMLLLKDIKAKVGVTLVNKVWPNLIFSPPYMRCALMDDKARERFSKLKKFYVQLKYDASFAYVVFEHDIPSVVTRNGSVYPSWVGEWMNRHPKAGQEQRVFAGELTVCRNGVTLSRKEGNGILNSVLQGGELSGGEELLFHSWDVLPLNDWKAGLCNIPYSDRLVTLYGVMVESDRYMSAVDTDVVTSLPEAYSIYSKCLAAGEEGCVIKSPRSIWKDNTSKDWVKLKLEVGVELRVYGFIVGEGKASGMLGSLCCSSEDGLLKANVGSGFSDEQRREIWANKQDWINRVITVKANEVISDKSDSVKSLFLPIFVERRDKTLADTLKEIEDQFEAAKQGII